MIFDKIAVALAFSHRCQALLTEALRLCQAVQAELLIIHIGPKTEAEEQQMEALLKNAKVGEVPVSVRWEEQGDPGKKILRISEEEHVDLLIAGALKKENFFKFYLGSTARRLLRRAKCSVLMLVEPSKYPINFRRVVMYLSDPEEGQPALQRALDLAHADRATQVHLLKDIKMMGLSLAISGEQSEEEYSEARKGLVGDELETVQAALDHLNTHQLKINIKVMAGKPGFEVSKFCQRIDADLLVMEAPQHRHNFLDRIFPGELEHIFNDLPTNLLILHPKP